MKKITSLLGSKHIPVIFLCLLWIAFSFPFLFQNKVLFPSDYLASNFSPWSAYPEYFSAVRNDSMPDIITQIYPWRFFAVETYKNLQIPLWNPYSFSGTPFLANYQSAVFSPLNIGFFIFPFFEWWGMMVLLQPLLAGIFTYLYARAIKLSKIGSVIPAISFMFCGFVTSWMAYGTLVYAFLFLPLALFAIEKYAQTQKARYLFLLSITIPFSFFSGHFQISLYFLLFVIGYLVFKYLQARTFLPILYSLLSILCGLLISAIQLFPSIELYMQSFRSAIFQKVEVVPWGYIPTLIAPDFFGNPVTRNAWFGHYAEWNGYIGLIPLMLAVYAVFRLKKNVTLFLSCTALISLLLAFQSPFLDLLIASRVPVLSTSALSRILVVFSFSAAILSGFGIDQLRSDIKANIYRYFILLVLVFTSIFITLWTISYLGLGMSFEHAIVGRSNLRFPTLMFLAFLVLLSCVRFLKLQSTVLIFSCLVVIIVSADLLRFSLKWVPYEPKDLVYPGAPVTTAYKKISGYDRVFGNFGAEGSVYYSLPSLEGYDALYIRRYGQFISYIDHGILGDSARSGVDLPLQGKHMLTAANFLGVKYFVHKVSDGQNVWEFPFWKYDAPSIKLIYDDKKFQILENTNAFPRVFLVSDVIIEKNQKRTLDLMFDEKTNLQNTAFLEKGESKKLSSGSAVIRQYTPNKIEIETQVDAQSFLVLTDVFYPGWVAYVDGVRSEIYRTDYAFRGVYVPKDTRSVVFSYEPASFGYGVVTAILGVMGISILCVLTRTKNEKKSK